MKLFLLRHGQTAYNRDGLGLGRADAPLTDFGLRQSEAAAARLAVEPLTRVYTSPLGRAATLAELVAAPHGLTPVVREELIEMDVGDAEGLTYRAMREIQAQFMERWNGDGFEHVPMPGGESLVAVANRTAPFVAELRELDQPAVAVVSHNFVTKVMVCQLLGIDIASFRSFTIDVASMCTFVLRDGRVSVSGLNDCCHLDSLNVHQQEGSLSD